MHGQRGSQTAHAVDVKEDGHARLSVQLGRAQVGGWTRNKQPSVYGLCLIRPLGLRPTQCVAQKLDNA